LATARFARGWRGSLEHRWGTISLLSRAWDHAGTALVHTCRESAWMLLATPATVARVTGARRG
jgi:hypothetical protein